MATREELELILKAQNQSKAAFEELNRQVEQTKGGLLETAKAGIAFGAGFAAAAEAIQGIVGAAANAARAIDDLAAKAERISNKALITGWSTDAVQSLQRLAENSQVSSEAVFRAVERMSRGAVEGSKGFQKLGIGAQEFLKLQPERQFEAAAVKIMSLQTAAERTALAMELFGRAGADLLPILEKVARGGSSEIVAMSNSQIEALKKTDDALDRLKGSWTDFKNQVTAAAAGLVNLPGLFDALASQISGIAAISRDQGFMKMLEMLIRISSGNVGAMAQVAGAGIAAQVPSPKGTFQVPTFNFPGITPPSGGAFEMPGMLTPAQVKGIELTVRANEKAAKEAESAWLEANREIVADLNARTREHERAYKAQTDAALRETERLLAEEERMNAKEYAVWIQAQQSKKEMAEAVGRALWEQEQRLVEESYKFAAATQNLGQAIGGTFGTALEAVGGYFQVMTALNDETVQNASATEKWANALNAASAAYKSGSWFQGAMAGAQAGAAFGGVGAIIGGAVGFFAGLLGGGNKKREEEARKAQEAAQKAAEEMRKRIEGLGSAMEGLNRLTAIWTKHLDSVGEATAKDAAQFQRLGLYAAATFAGMVRETGDVWAALQKIQPTLDALISAQDKFGFAASATTQKLLDLWTVASANKDVMDSLSALTELMKGLGDAGIRNQELFTAFGQDIAENFDALIAGGASSNQALALMQPTLQMLWEAQYKFGYQTDAATQKILDQAATQGLVGENMMSVNERILDVLLAIADALGAQIPDALRRMGDAAQQQGDRTRRALSGIPGAGGGAAGGGGGAAAGGGGGGGGGGGRGGREMAQGGIILPFVPRAAQGIITAQPGGGPVWAGEGGKAELIAPVADLAKAIGQAAAQASGGTIHVHVHVDGREIANTVVRYNQAGALPIAASSIRK